MTKFFDIMPPQPKKTAPKKRKNGLGIILIFILIIGTAVYFGRSFKIETNLKANPAPINTGAQSVTNFDLFADNTTAQIKDTNYKIRILDASGNAEKTNREITALILQQLQKPDSLIRHVADRPGHDRRYAIDNTKIRQELGWKLAYNFNDGMRATIQWYLDNRQWWERVKSGEYQEFYARWYEQR